MRLAMLLIGIATSALFQNCRKVESDSAETCPAYDGEIPPPLSTVTYSKIRQDSRLGYEVSQVQFDDAKASVTFTDNSQKAEEVFVAEFQIVSREVMKRPVIQ